jgi:hypothetical protein
MNKIKNLVTVLSVSFGIAVLDGMFSWELADGFYTLLGLVILVCLVWLLKIVYGKNE